MLSVEPSLDTNQTGWHQLTVIDAQYLGRLSAAGLGLPNAPHLSQPAASVESVTDQVLQQEINRLITAARNVGTIRGVAGLAHSQLVLTDESIPPLQIALVGGRNIHKAPTLRIHGHIFQCLLDTRISLGSGFSRVYDESCFSAGMVVARTCRPEIRALTALTPDGSTVSTKDIKGFAARLIQHESDHARGLRAADYVEARRRWEPRPRYLPTRSKVCSDEQWLAISRNQDYNFFPTEELRAAFEKGKAVQASRNL